MRGGFGPLAALAILLASSLVGSAGQVAPSPQTTPLDLGPLTLLSGPGISSCADIGIHGDQATLLEMSCNTQDIRPGVRGNGCTLNFVVADADDYYIGSAGHCGGVGAAYSVPGVGAIGTVVFQELGGDLLSTRDWAFIKIDEDKQSLVSGQMVRFGGPFAADPALLTRSPVPGDVIFQYGHGAGWGQEDATKGRVGEVVALLGTTAFAYIGNVGGGDSGSPVRFATGEAAGIAVAVAGVATGDNRGYVEGRCALIDATSGTTGSCAGYETACFELDNGCNALWRPGALHGLVIVTRFDAALAALEEFLGHPVHIVPGALPEVILDV